MATPANPYANYGGNIANDPYAAYGGKKATASAAQPAAPAAYTAPEEKPPVQPTSVDEQDEANLQGLENAGGIGNAGHIVGAAKSFLQPAVTIAKLLHRGGEAIHEGLGNAVIPEEGIHRFEHMTETKGSDETTGQVIENIAEFMLGDEALKSLSLADKLRKIAPALKVFEKSPRAAAAFSTAIRQGAVSTGQGLAHGETPGTALEQGAITGGTGLAFEGLTAGAKSFLQRNAATMEKVGGVDTVIPASVRNAKPSPQQIAGRESITKAAQDSLADRLGEVNQSRAVPETGQKMLPARTGPFEFQIKGLEPTEAEAGSKVVPAAEMPRSRITGLPDTAKPHLDANGEVVWPDGKNYTNTNADEVAAFKAKHGISSRSSETVGEETNVGKTRRQIGTTTETVPPSMVRDQPYMTSAKDGAEPHSVSTPEGGGVLKTTDPQIAKNHVKTLNEIMAHPDFEKLPEAQQQAISAARDDIQKQLGDFHQHMELSDPRYGKPNFPQIDVPRAVKQIGSYTDAANYLNKIATDGYNSISDALQLNAISKGKFATIRNANRAAWDAYKGASSVEAMTQAEHAIDLSNKQMADLLKNDIGGSVTPKELQGFNDAYGQAQKMKYVAHAVDSSFSGNASASARSWEYRGFDGNKLMANLGRLEQKFGRTSLERIVGRDSLNTLYQVAELNRTGAARARFGVALHPVAQWLVDNAGRGFSHLAPIFIGGELGRMAGVGWGIGATAAEGTALATKKVFNAILSNPKIAQNLIFAIESGARPQYYAPMIGTMVQNMERSRDHLIQATAPKGEDKR